MVITAKAAKVFGCNLDSVYFNISTTLTLIRGMDSAIEATMDKIHVLVKQFHSEKFVWQIYLLNSITGIGFLSSVTIMREIGDFSVFKNPKQLLLTLA